MKRLIWLLVLLGGCVTSGVASLDGTSKQAWEASVEDAMREMDEKDRLRFQQALMKLSLQKVSEGKSNEEILKELHGTTVEELLK